MTAPTTAAPSVRLRWWAIPLAALYDLLTPANPGRDQQMVRWLARHGAKVAR